MALIKLQKVEQNPKVVKSFRR